MLESMIFYRSFYEALEGLNDDMRLRVLEAVLRYGLYEESPKLTGVELSLFRLIKPQVDANVERRENGKKGGRPKKPMVINSETIGFETENHRLEAEKPNVNVNDNVNVNANDNDDDKKEKRKKIIDDAERKRLEERDRILEEDDYAARHEGAGEVYFEPTVKLGWVKKEEDPYEMQNGIPKPPAMSNEDYKKMMDRLTRFKERRTT